jgi:hypothetical protein
VSGQLHTLTTFPPGGPTIRYEAEWAPEPALTLWIRIKSLASLPGIELFICLLFISILIINVQTGSVVHPTSYSMDPAGFFLRGKAAKA